MKNITTSMTLIVALVVSAPAQADIFTCVTAGVKAYKSVDTCKGKIIEVMIDGQAMSYKEYISMRRMQDVAARESETKTKAGGLGEDVISREINNLESYKKHDSSDDAWGRAADNKYNLDISVRQIELLESRLKSAKTDSPAKVRALEDEISRAINDLDAYKTYGASSAWGEAEDSKHNLDVTTRQIELREAARRVR